MHRKSGRRQRERNVGPPRIVLAALAATLAACAQRGGIEAGGDELPARCERAYAALDRAVASAGVGDGSAARLRAFPYLRADRLLASFAGEALSPEAFAAWVAALRSLDAQARLVEIGNLPAEPTQALRTRLEQERLGDLPPPALLEGCAAVLAERDLARAERRDALRAAAVVPDDYSDARRVAGLYPLSVAPIAWQRERETRERFAQPPSAMQGAPRRYVALAATTGAPVENLLAGARDALGFPMLSPESLDRLLAAHAPQFVIDAQDDDDRLGTPVIASSGNGARVDTSAAAVFTRAAFTRFDGALLVQLVYTAWFPARRAQGALDASAGHLDGLIWRVTLDRDGEPMVYDSVRASGADHLFFATPRVTPKPPPAGLEDAAVVAQRLPVRVAQAPVILELARGTHAIRRVTLGASAAATATPYALTSEDALRSRPVGDGSRRSLYGPDGIVPGTERDERFLMWPTGIDRVGSMRQWGRHPTALLGRRHFDEAFLIERYFLRAAP